MKVSQTTNIRIYKNTHDKLKQLAKYKRQQIIVVIDELVNDVLRPTKKT